MDAWHGVSTNEQGYVTALQLSSNNLNGQIPSELGDLSELVQLDLSENDLTEAIPLALGNLTELIELQLNANQLSGPLPSELGGLSNLQTLSVANNTALSGEVPVSFANLEELSAFFAEGTGVCLPADPLLQSWSAGVTDLSVSPCGTEAALELSVSSLTIAEGGSSTYTVSLASQPTAPVTIAITGQSGTDLSLDVISLTFNESLWSTPQTVTVSAGQDPDAADDVATLLHTASGGDYAGVTVSLSVMVTDDESVGTPPTIAITGMPAKINATAALNVTFTFSQDVTGFMADDVAVTGGTKGTFSATNATTYTLAVTPISGSNVTVTVVADAATDGLNTGPVSAVSATAIWDAAAPTVAISDVLATISSTTAFTATFTFSEDVTGFITDDVAVTGGTKGAFSATNAQTYTLVITPSGSADVVVTVAADAATDGLNTGPASAVLATATWDAGVPTVTIDGVPAKINSTTAFTATFTFSKDVTGFIADDVAVTGGTKGAFSATNAQTYTLVITPSGSADVVVTVAADAATDGLNTGPASAVLATATWDAGVPTVTIDGVPAKINSTTAFTATFTFSKDVTGFIADDVAVTGGTKGTFSATNATTYTLAVTPISGSNVTVTVVADAATDGLNTGPVSAVSATAIWDAAAPTVAISDVLATISSTTAFTATFTFSEDVTGFITDDVAVTGGTKGAFSATNAQTYTLVITPSGSADVVVTVAADAATDGLNTGPLAAVSATGTWDAIPTVSISGLPSRINSTAELTATFTFSEDVTGFITDDVRVTGGTKGTFSGSGASYTLGITPSGSVTVFVWVVQDAATDGSGNAGPPAVVSATVHWDAVPTLTIIDLPSKISSTAELTATFVYSEEVTGFITDDVVVAGGTKGTFTAIDTWVYRLAVTPAGGADVVVTVLADVATDGFNTGPPSAVSATATWDAAPPTVTITGVPATISSTVDFTGVFTFSKAVTGFVTGDIVVAGGTKGRFSEFNAHTYTLAITPSGSADVVVTVAADAATDGVNMGPTSAVSATATWDAIPTVRISGLPPKIKSTAALTATLTFSEDVTGFITDDVAVTGGMKGTFSGSGKDYSLGVTPSGSADVIVSVVQDAATDAGGNTGPPTAQSFTVFWDAIAPTVTITGIPAKINSTAALTATFTFSEEVTGFEIGDITVSGGTVGTFTAVSEEVYTLAVTPTGSADVVVTVATDAASDGANTGPVSAVSATATWDTTPRNVLTSASSLTIAEGGSGTYSVWLSSQPSETVTLWITGQSSTDLMLDRTSLKFHAIGSTNLWSDPQTVTITAGQDVDWNTDHVILTNTAVAGGYGGTRTSVWITTQEDETPPSPPHAYVVQAVHSFFNTVPLIAGESAVLRVFPTATAPINSPPLPRAVATFYVNNQVTHTVNLASKTGSIPTEVWPAGFQQSYDAQIPASVVKPGLELIVEIDPDDQVPASVGLTKRMPQSGRISLDVITVPTFDITFVPLVTTWFTGVHDVEAIAQRLAANPGSDHLLDDTRTLLPIKDISATAHATVMVSERGALFLYNTVKSLRALENGSGHWMGLHTDPDGARGLGQRPGVITLSRPNNITMAHEFGHNLSLQHAPCGRNIERLDPNYPYPDGVIGSWGVNNTSLLGPGGTYDLMSYCSPKWISDYHFKKASDHRTSAALSKNEELPVASKPSGPSLLLWGGMDADSRPYLEPVFVVEAAPTLPQAPGPWQLVGHAAGGDEMFRLTFTMPEVAHGEGASAFAFVVPLPQGHILNSVTLAGPGGSFNLDGEHNDPMAIVIDESSGQVTGFLKNFDPSGDSRVSAISNKFGGNAQRVLFSRGIPDPGDQN
ncbi:MAG: Ig-like domain-containing protein [Bacteroidota bacterium]|nr:Ig-like domain-containing protein [Bacteroidota bacterium]